MLSACSADESRGLSLSRRTCYNVRCTLKVSVHHSELITIVRGDPSDDTIPSCLSSVGTEKDTLRCICTSSVALSERVNVLTGDVEDISRDSVTIIVW